MDFVNGWSEKSEIPQKRFIAWLGIARSKFYNWGERYGKVNEHNGKVPRDFWLEAWEKEAIVKFFIEHPGEGYRRLTFMMLDADVVAAGPTSVWRVLHERGLLTHWRGKPSKKGTGFVQPLKPHEHWHVDVSYINICGTFYYLCSVLDGCSRYIVHWDIRQSMTEGEIEIILERAKEKFPEARPRVITDNGPQFVAKDFKEFIRISGMTHVRTSPYYPQSNGKIERWHGSLKRECIRPKTPLSLDDAKRIVADFVDHYNNTRLNSAIGFVAPHDRLLGRHETIFAQRDQKLETAREGRRLRRLAARKEEEETTGVRVEKRSHCGNHSGKLTLPGETEAGSAGGQPAKGYPGQANRTMQNSCGAWSAVNPSPIPLFESPAMPQKNAPSQIEKGPPALA